MTFETRSTSLVPFDAGFSAVDLPIQEKVEIVRSFLAEETEAIERECLEVQARVMAGWQEHETFIHQKMERIQSLGEARVKLVEGTVEANDRTIEEKKAQAAATEKAIEECRAKIAALKGGAK